MNYLLNKIGMLGALLMLGTSCGDYLDTVPDNRTEINTVAKLGKLVGSSYPRANYAVNLSARVDLISDQGLGYQENLSNTDPFYWRDVASTAQDSPAYFWSACYTAIAHANEAVAAAQRLGTPEAAEFGAEARISRAFSHLLLATNFAKFYDRATTNDSPGIPYVTEPEDVVIKQYERGTVASTYEKIEEDLLAGLKDLGSDAKYSRPRYHFNTAAANAFATRFYLFKGEFDKVVSYATKVIVEPSQFVTFEDGTRNVSATDAANVYAFNNFQPWTTYYITASQEMIKMNFSKADNKSNLLLCEMVSSQGNYGGTWRYSCKKTDTDILLANKNPTGGRWAWADKIVHNKEAYYITMIRAIFSKSSVNANSGFFYIVFGLLRNEEVLLSRAEAYLHLDQTDKALADLNIYCRQRIKDYVEEANCLTPAKVYDFYKTEVADPETFINKENSFGTASWSDERKAMLLFTLDCRRGEFVWEGQRYWDMWRYKIPITHTNKEGVSNTLWPGDDRWVLQIPEEAALSGVGQNTYTNLLSPEW